MTISLERPSPIESGRKNTMSKLSSDRTWCIKFQGILQPNSSAPKTSADGDAYVTATNSSSPAGNLVTNIHSRECWGLSFDGHARLGRDRFVDEQIGWGAMADTSPEGVYWILKSVGSLSEACCSDRLDEDNSCLRAALHQPQKKKKGSRDAPKNHAVHISVVLLEFLPSSKWNELLLSSSASSMTGMNRWKGSRFGTGSTRARDPSVRLLSCSSNLAEEEWGEIWCKYCCYWCVKCQLQIQQITRLNIVFNVTWCLMSLW